MTANLSTVEMIEGITDVLKQMLVDPSWEGHDLWRRLDALRQRAICLEKSLPPTFSREVPVTIEGILRYLTFLKLRASHFFVEHPDDVDMKHHITGFHRALKVITEILHPFESAAA